MEYMLTLTKISAGAVGARAVPVDCLNCWLSTWSLVVREAKVIVRTEVEAANVPPGVPEGEEQENKLENFLRRKSIKEKQSETEGRREDEG